MNDTENRMARTAKQKLMVTLEHSFFASGLFALQMLEDNSQPTMCTDGVHLWVNTEFVKTLTDQELRTVLVHEVLHCGLQHVFRREGRDPKKWNVSCDYAVNLFIEEYSSKNRHCFKLPQGALVDIKYKGKSAEAIYELLVKEERQQNKPPPPPAPSPAPPPQDEPGEASDEPGDSEPGEASDEPGEASDKPGDEPGDEPSDEPSDEPGDEASDEPGDEASDEPGDEYKKTTTGYFVDAPDKAPENQDDPVSLSEQWSQLFAEACVSSKPGMEAGLAKRMIEQATTSTVPWQQILQRFVSVRAMTDYTYARPDYRAHGFDFVLPGLDDETAGEMVFAIDTSGSVSNRMVAQFCAEAQAAMEHVRPKTLHLVYFDAVVQKAQEFSPGDVITPDPVGGGGTDFRPVFKWIEEKRINPLCVIVLTDMEGIFPPEDPGVPTLWCTYGFRKTAPFGEVVEISCVSY